MGLHTNWVYVLLQDPTGAQKGSNPMSEHRSMAPRVHKVISWSVYQGCHWIIPVVPMVSLRPPTGVILRLLVGYSCRSPLNWDDPSATNRNHQFLRIWISRDSKGGSVQQFWECNCWHPQLIKQLLSCTWSPGRFATWSTVLVVIPWYQAFLTMMPLMNAYWWLMEAWWRWWFMRLITTAIPKHVHSWNMLHQRSHISWWQSTTSFFIPLGSDVPRCRLF